VVATRSVYFAQAPIEGVIAVGPGLHTRRGWRPTLDTSAPVQPNAKSLAQRVRLADIADWFAQRDTISDYP
jgi:hypothetical protein